MLTVAYAECLYAVCRYAECRYADCRGAELITGCLIRRRGKVFWPIFNLQVIPIIILFARILGKLTFGTNVIGTFVTAPPALTWLWSNKLE